MGSSPRTCPNCGKPAEEAATECLGCGVVFAKWRPPALKPAAAAAPAAASDKHAKLFARLQGLAVLCVATLLAWLWLKPPRSAPLMPGSHADQVYGFAVAAPPGWELKVQETREADLLRLLTITGPGGQDYPIRAVVALTPQPVPRPKPNFNPAFEKLVSAVLAGQFQPNVRENVPATVDGLASLRGEGQAALSVSRQVQTFEPDPKSLRSTWDPYRGWVMTAPPGAPMVPVTRTESESVPLRFTVNAVRGMEWTYLVGVAGTEADMRKEAAAVEALMGSFRVLHRPWSLAHIWSMITGEFKQEATLFCFGLLLGLYKWIFSGLLE